MNKILLMSGLCAMAALVSQTAQAEIKVRAGIASSTYTLGGDYITATSSYKPTNVGLTLSGDGGFYIDGTLSSGTGTHDGWKNTGHSAEKFKRSDMALIMGASKFNQNNGIAGTFYVGYKSGTTTLGAQNVLTVAWNEETFESSGFVFGGGGSFPIASGRAGSIGVNAGLGVMGATWKDDAGFNKKSNTAVGFSFGANYTYPITSNLGVVVDYKGNAYSYKFPWSNNTTTKTVNESISAIGATVYAKF